MRSLSLLLSTAILVLAAAFWLPGLGNSSALADPGGVVYFHRPAGFAGAFTRPDVIINGEKIGTIGSGECHRARLPAGRHKIEVRDQRSLLSRLGLNKASVNVHSGGEVFITVRPLQQPREFNEPATVYDLTIADRGHRCH